MRTVGITTANSIQILLLGACWIYGTISCSKAPQTNTAASPTPEPSVIAKSTPPPSLETRRLAPPGVLYVVQYASVTTDSGVVGFVPGTRVQVVQDKGDTITIRNGTLKADMSIDNLTNDLDLAALAARHDAQSQDAVARFLAGQETAAQTQADKKNEAFDQQQREATARRNSAAIAAKGPSSLNKGAYNEKYSLPYWYRRGNIWYHR